ncbi:MAG: hypothetical protein K0S74_1695 [Chlamydiales bacterium]|jgi:serine/threonine protein kinase|nr:hypothetical protein [Chlamydiales bacterium]
MDIRTNPIHNSLLYPQHSEWNKEDQSVLDTLKGRNYIIGDVTKYKAIIPTNGTASKACKILFLKTFDSVNHKTHSYVIKEMPEMHTYEFNREEGIVKNKSIEKFRDLVNEYRTKYHVKLPELVAYHGATKVKVKSGTILVTVMSKAKGQSLAEIRKILREPTTSIDLKTRESQTIEMATEIGKQMGALSRVFFEERKTLLVHGDIGAQNYLYDPKEGQVYWIDLGGTKELPYVKLPGSYESYFDTETDIFKTMWWSFFPFQDRHEFSSMWDATTQKKTSLKEEVEKHGLSVLNIHRTGIRAGTAFYESYFEQVKDLELAKGWGKEKDSFVSSIKTFINLYKEEIHKAFGKDSQTVIDYLFAPIEINPSSEISMKPEHTGVNSASEQSNEAKLSTRSMIEILGHNIAEVLHAEIIQETKGSIESPLYLALRDSTAYQYNSDFLYRPRNYQQNLEFLQREKVQKAIRNVTDVKVANSSHMIEHRTWKLTSRCNSEDTANFVSFFTGAVKELLFIKIYSNLVEGQQSCLKMALNNRILKLE